MEKYKVVEKENINYKYYKNIPYIRKKDFDEKFYKFIGQTKLQKVNRNKDFDAIINYENEDFIVEDSVLGIKKGYIQVDENSYVILKTLTPILLLIILGLLLLGSLLGSILFVNHQKVDLVNPIVEEIKETNPTEQEKVIYKLSFDGNGAIGSMASINVLENDTIKLPENNFKKKGYTFIGWAFSKFGKVVYLDEEEIKNLKSDEKELILYAMFSINKYKVIFLDYNDNILHEKYQNYNSKVELPEIPTRIGYKFLKWDNDTTKILKETRYKALYEIIPYNISYNLNGGKINNILPTTYNIESEPIKITNPTKKGYTFSGWSVNHSLNCIKDFVLRTGSYGDKNLSAKYKPNLYNISFDVNEGHTELEQKEVYFDSKYGELPEPKREGYTFSGWINDKEEIVDENTKYTEDNDITLKATWKANQYTVSFNTDGGSVLPENKNVTYDSAYGELPEPIKEGYNFKGWYLNEQKVNENTIVKTSSNHELIARWKKINYVIEYNTVGGILEANVTIYDVEDEDFTIPHPTKEGYTFTGWTGANGTTPEKDVIIKSGTTGNYKYQANWQVNYYNVNYYINNSLWTTRSVAYGSSVPNLTYSINDKQNFSGWSGYISIMPAHDINVNGIVRETNCGVLTGHGSFDRVSSFVNVFNQAGFNAYLVNSTGAYAVSSDQNYAYSTAVNMLNYVWANTSSSGSHALNYIELHCDNGHSFSITR